MAKNIILLSDGTGNSSAKLFKTNVWRLFEALDVSDPTIQLAFYDNGVGTSSFKPLAIVGGVFGVGLKRNVIDIYSFLCRNYQEGDRIYGFGFSRGSFTMRVVAGLVAREGLVPWTNNEAKLARDARAAYRRFRSRFRTSFGVEVPFRWLRDLFLPKPPLPRHRPCIHFLGLWDTVDAYGGPIEEITRAIDYWLWPLSMPDRIMSNKIRRACHALALDDERRAFWPVLWDEDLVGCDGNPGPMNEGWSPPADSEIPPEVARPLHAIDLQRLSQVWFVGMHSDVGGGYPQNGLSYVTLDWMMSRAIVYGLRLKPSAIAELRSYANQNDKLNDSRHGLAGYYRYQPRKVAALYAAGPEKPDIFHDLRYLWRTLKNLGAHDPQSDIDNGLYADSAYSPLIHESVFQHINAGMDGYSPIVIPAKYGVTTRMGEVVYGRYESSSQAEARARRQERVWNWVWGRRVVYFTTVAVLLALAATPLLLLKWPGHGDASLAAPLIPVIDLLARFLPSFASYWIDAFKEAPTWLLLAGASLGALLFLGGRLERRIHDMMRPLWRKNLVTAPHSVPPDPLPSDLLYEIRSTMIYRGFFYALTHWVLPAFCLFAIVYGLAVGTSRILFALADSTGLICRATDKASLTSVVGKASPFDFATNELCHATGLSVIKDATYRLTLAITDNWEDGHRFNEPAPDKATGILTDPNGFGQNQALPGMLIGIPLRRLIAANWFQTVVRVGRWGLDEQALQFGRRSIGPNNEPSYAADFKPKSDGEVFLFVNDSVIGIPGLTNLFYRTNNKGSARVTIERISP
jgi:uncharacterized protein (DUF2235 family)